LALARTTGTDEETTRLVLSICHEAANWTGAIRLSAHLIDHEQTPVELASGAMDVADLSARIGSLLALVRPLLTGETARETGVFPAAVLAGLADVLEDHGGRGVHLSVEPCGDLPEVAGNPETLHQLIVTLAYYAIVEASPDGAVAVRAEFSESDSSVSFVVEDSGPEEADLASWESAVLRGRVLACTVASKVLSGLGGTLEARRKNDRTQIVMTVPSL
jgi:signal transduction histidine kinase